LVNTSGTLLLFSMQMVWGLGFWLGSSVMCTMSADVIQALFYSWDFESIPRAKLHILCRCSQIMGRNETDELSAAQIFYPCMQCADIFFLKVWSLIHARHPIHVIQLCWIQALSAASDSKWWCTSCSALN
jgi:hypothetical protein